MNTLLELIARDHRFRVAITPYELKIWLLLMKTASESDGLIPASRQRFLHLEYRIGRKRFEELLTRFALDNLRLIERRTQGDIFLTDYPNVLDS